ncbi:MAG: NigD-like C-terminal domain-containing protein [Bacteroidales bacterium]|jgi:hypothetical protein|nr:NigD-like C-terminal domain-containing protein [Bacteroidales bacterium]
MKGKVIKFIAVLFAVFTLVSCSKEGIDLDKYYLAYGVVEGDNPDYKIKLDNGMTLIVDINRVPNFDVKDGQRVLADYTPLDEIPDGEQTLAPFTQSRVILNYLYDILQKDYLINSDIDTEEKRDSIGHDYINVNDSWIGSKFLNIHFEFYMNSPYLKHMVNLVYDDARSTDEDIYFNFMHNAKNDTPNFRAFGRVSFDIEDILEEVGEGETINIHLIWDGYESGNQSKTITYRK